MGLDLAFVKFRSLILFVKVVISGAGHLFRQFKLEGDPAMKLNAEQLLLVAGFRTDESLPAFTPAAVAREQA